MKGCYGVTIHYLRVLCLFVALPLANAAGMAFQGPLRIGNLSVDIGPWELEGLALLAWIIVAARVMRKH